MGVVAAIVLYVCVPGEKCAYLGGKKRGVAGGKIRRGLGKKYEKREKEGPGSGSSFEHRNTRRMSLTW